MGEVFHSRITQELGINPQQFMQKQPQLARLIEEHASYACGNLTVIIDKSSQQRALCTEYLRLCALGPNVPSLEFGECLDALPSQIVSLGKRLGKALVLLTRYEERWQAMDWARLLRGSPNVAVVALNTHSGETKEQELVLPSLKQRSLDRKEITQFLTTKLQTIAEVQNNFAFLWENHPSSSDFDTLLWCAEELLSAGLLKGSLQAIDLEAPWEIYKNQLLLPTSFNTHSETHHEMGLSGLLRQVESQSIRNALQQSKGSIAQAARNLRLPASTLRSRMVALKQLAVL